MNIIDTIAFKNETTGNIHRIPVYGNHRDPLFLVNDVICDILGMSEPKDNRFFRDNRQDTRYVMISQIGRSCPALQERFKRSNKEHIYFFTEFGLYKCLFRSKHPVADAF
jgi:prophage antirepressor-like protein